MRLRLSQRLARRAASPAPFSKGRNRLALARNELVAKGEKAAVEFAVEWLSAMFGADVKRTLRRTQVTNWNAEPWALGASSAAAPGGQWARKALMEPVRGRVYFAGEAAHETMWGTVAGAWESGERAANTVIRRLAGLPDIVEAAKPEPAAPARRQRRQP